MPQIKSSIDRWLQIISLQIAGAPIPMPLPKINSSTEQWLEQIFLQLGGFVPPPPPAAIILADGSVSFLPGAIQIVPATASIQSTNGGGITANYKDGILSTTSIGGTATVSPLAITTINTLNTAGVTMGASGGIIQKTPTTGSHTHAIGGIIAGAVVPDAGNYLEVVIDGVTKKLIIAV